MRATDIHSGLTAEQVRELLAYDPLTGALAWRVTRTGTAKSGSLAGSIRNGYMRTSVYGRSYLNHRLIWLFVTGQWPINEIDHINGRKDDNRFDNLRDVTSLTNKENIRRPSICNKLGVLGVSKRKNRKTFRAQIRVRGNVTLIGYYKSQEEARAAYLDAKRRLHAGCTI